MNTEKSVLIVDDEPSVRYLFRFSLRKLPVKILEAENGEIALTLIRSGIPFPDIILMDYRMPVMNGVQATEEILKLNILAKIIFVTADHSIKKEAMAAGAIKFFAKPMERAVLLDIVSNVLELP